MLASSAPGANARPHSLRQAFQAAVRAAGALSRPVCGAGCGRAAACGGAGQARRALGRACRGVGRSMALPLMRPRLSMRACELCIVRVCVDPLSGADSRRAGTALKNLQPWHLWSAEIRNDSAPGAGRGPARAARCGRGAAGARASWATAAPRAARSRGLSARCAAAMCCRRDRAALVMPPRALFHPPCK